MKRRLKILLVEDSARDAELIERRLRRNKLETRSKRVETRSEFIRALKDFKPDLILADYRMSHFDASAAIKLKQQHLPAVPLIIVCGAISADTAVECMKLGADDYLPTDRLTRLGEAIHSSLGKRRLLEKKQKAQAAQQESASRFRALFERSLDLVYIHDFEGNFLDANAAALRQFGYEKEEILSLNFTSLISPDQHSRIFQSLADLKKNGTQNVMAEYTVRRKDGGYIHLETKASVIYQRGKPFSVFVIACDVTERKKAEQLLRDSLNEKEVLLKEIHHRVKNNLQIVSSLLRLQSSYIDDPRLQEFLKESENRIWSMALIHEQLYQSGNLARIKMNEYIRSLISHLFSAYGDPTATIELKIKVPDITLSIDKMIPLALIINELVSNILKHAFPDGRHGKIKIELQQDAGQQAHLPQFVLVVSDNGVGLPEDVDPARVKTLGLQLVLILTKQINGMITANRQSGTEFRITFQDN